MRESLWDEIERKHRFHRGEPQTWKPGLLNGLQVSEHAGAFASMASPAVCAALDRIFMPDGWKQPPRWGQPLVTFPTGGNAWNIPHRNWHIDAGGSNVAAPLDAVIVFAFLNTVPPQGVARWSYLGRINCYVNWRDGRAIRPPYGQQTRANSWPELILGLASYGRVSTGQRRFVGSRRMARRSAVCG